MPDITYRSSFYTQLAVDAHYVKDKEGGGGETTKKTNKKNSTEDIKPTSIPSQCLASQLSVLTPSVQLSLMIGSWLAEISNLKSYRSTLKSSHLNQFQQHRIWPNQSEENVGVPTAEFSCGKKPEATNKEASHCFQLAQLEVKKSEWPLFTDR